MTAVAVAADRLWHAWKTATPCDPVRDMIGDTDIDLAYQVQEVITQRRIAAGDRLVGRKIGLTATTVQQQLGVDQPDFGPLFDSTLYHDGEDVAAAGLISPRIEAEITLRLSRPLTSENHTVDDIRDAVDQVLPSLEIVDSRIRDWDITITDTVADAASAGAIVIGTQPASLDDLDLLDLPMNLSINDAEASAGLGRNSLGNPLVAAVWLADELARRGTPLQAGDLVMTGALGPMVAVGPGDVVHADFGPLGQVGCRFSPTVDQTTPDTKPSHATKDTR